MGLLTLFPCFTMRSLLQETILYGLLQCEAFPWGSCQDQTAPACVPHKVTNPASKPDPLHRSRGPDRSLLPMGSQPPSGNHLLQCGVLQGCRRISAPPWTSLCYRGTAAPPCSAPQGSLGSSTCSTSCPSFYTDLGVCRAVRLSFLSPGCNCEGFLFFLLLLKYPRGTITAADLEQWQVFLGASWHWLTQTLQEASGTFLKNLLL